MAGIFSSTNENSVCVASSGLHVARMSSMEKQHEASVHYRRACDFVCRDCFQFTGPGASSRRHATKYLSRLPWSQRCRHSAWRRISVRRQRCWRLRDHNNSGNIHVEYANGLLQRHYRPVRSIIDQREFLCAQRGIFDGPQERHLESQIHQFEWIDDAYVAGRLVIPAAPVPFPTNVTISTDSQGKPTDQLDQAGRSGQRFPRPDFR